MKGVVLAGGTGSRLLPLTKVTNKHLLPVFDRPMVYYPLECLAKAGIKDVLLVTGGNNSDDFPRLLGDGRELGLKRLNYAHQESPGGVAQALGLAEKFADGGPICLILGDNIVEYSIRGSVERFERQAMGARILIGHADEPEAYGVVEIHDGEVTRIVEKPQNPASNWAVIGIFFYDATVFDIIRSLRPSFRNELEITDVNNVYVQRRQMRADAVIGWWADAGRSIDFYLKTCVQVADSGTNKELQETG